MQGQLADLIQKYGAVVGYLEHPHPSLGVGPGKSALFVAEEFRLHQLGGNGTAIDGKKGVAGPSAVFINVGGADFFSGAAFAGEQHRAVTVRDALAYGQHTAHFRTGRHDAAVFGPVPEIAGDPFIFFLAFPPLLNELIQDISASGVGHNKADTAVLPENGISGGEEIVAVTVLQQTVHLFAQGDALSNHRTVVVAPGHQIVHPIAQDVLRFSAQVFQHGMADAADHPVAVGDHHVVGGLYHGLFQRDVTEQIGDKKLLKRRFQGYAPSFPMASAALTGQAVVKVHYTLWTGGSSRDREKRTFFRQTRRRPPLSCCGTGLLESLVRPVFVRRSTK